MTRPKTDPQQTKKGHEKPHHHQRQDQDLEDPRPVARAEQTAHNHEKAGSPNPRNQTAQRQHLETLQEAARSPRLPAPLRPEDQTAHRPKELDPRAHVADGSAQARDPGPPADRSAAHGIAVHGDARPPIRTMGIAAGRHGSSGQGAAPRVAAAAARQRRILREPLRLRTRHPRTAHPRLHLQEIIRRYSVSASHRALRSVR